jgi:RNA polymerase sigma-70 factor (ECF subfamily)
MTVKEYNDAVDLYSDRLFRFVLKSLNDVHTAEDIVQESYEKLWKNVKNVNAPKVKSYLFTTAYHAMIDQIRKNKRVDYVEEFSLPERSHESSYSDLNEILQKGIALLPEIQRIVLLLRDYEGYSYKEIGEMANLNEAQVKVYIYRARVFMKAFIVKMETVI